MLDARTLNFAPLEVNSMDGSQHNTQSRNKKLGSNTKQSTNQGNQPKHSRFYVPILISNSRKPYSKKGSTYFQTKFALSSENIKTCLSKQTAAPCLLPNYD